MEMPPSCGKHHGCRTTSAVRRGSQKEKLRPPSTLMSEPHRQKAVASVSTSGRSPETETGMVFPKTIGNMHDQQRSVMGFGTSPEHAPGVLRATRERFKSVSRWCFASSASARALASRSRTRSEGGREASASAPEITLARASVVTSESVPAIVTIVQRKRVKRRGRRST